MLQYEEVGVFYLWNYTTIKNEPDVHILTDNSEKKNNVEEKQVAKV